MNCLKVKNGDTGGVLTLGAERGQRPLLLLLTQRAAHAGYVFHVHAQHSRDVCVLPSLLGEKLHQQASRV